MPVCPGKDGVLTANSRDSGSWGCPPGVEMFRVRGRGHFSFLNGGVEKPYAVCTHQECRVSHAHIMSLQTCLSTSHGPRGHTWLRTACHPRVSAAIPSGPGASRHMPFCFSAAWQHRASPVLKNKQPGLEQRIIWVRPIVPDGGEVTGASP